MRRRFGLMKSPISSAKKFRLISKFCSVFGNSADKIAGGWREKGGYEGFNRHLRDVGSQFSHIDVHPDTWLTARPASSDSVHVFIKAAQILEGDERIDKSTIANGESASARLIWRLRRAFFHECQDISERRVQCDVAEQTGFSSAPIEAEIDSGAAFAALAADYHDRERLKIEGSPTFVLNEGRQKLYGNLGYRVIEANIRELLRTPTIGENELVLIRSRQAKREAEIDAAQPLSRYN